MRLRRKLIICSQKKKCIKYYKIDDFSFNGLRKNLLCLGDLLATGEKKAEFWPL